MSQHLSPKPIYLKNLSRRWQAFVRQCASLLYGELQNCRVEAGAVVSVGRVIGTHTPNPPVACSPDLEGKPLPKNWVSFMTLCARPGLKIIASIKIADGSPVVEFTEEGQWSFNESG